MKPTNQPTNQNKIKLLLGSVLLALNVEAMADSNIGLTH
jgi:hypothetical protein